MSRGSQRSRLACAFLKRETTARAQNAIPVCALCISSNKLLETYSWIGLHRKYTNKLFEQIEKEQCQEHIVHRVVPCETTWNQVCFPFLATFPASLNESLLSPRTPKQMTCDLQQWPARKDRGNLHETPSNSPEERWQIIVIEGTSPCHEKEFEKDSIHRLLRRFSLWGDTVLSRETATDLQRNLWKQRRPHCKKFTWLKNDDCQVYLRLVTSNSKDMSIRNRSVAILISSKIWHPQGWFTIKVNGQIHQLILGALRIDG